MSKTKRLSDLPEQDRETGDILAIVETPKGSRNKYDYDPELMTFRLAGVLPAGSVFPFDFGFIPSTKADDGDIDTGFGAGALSLAHSERIDGLNL